MKKFFITILILMSIIFMTSCTETPPENEKESIDPNVQSSINDVALDEVKAVLKKYEDDTREDKLYFPDLPEGETLPKVDSSDDFVITENFQAKIELENHNMLFDFATDGTKYMITTVQFEKK